MPQGTEAAEDTRLVSGVLDKDRKATAEFADWIYPFVRRRLVPRSELVENMAQEILFSAWQGLANFHGDGNLRGWLVGIARHKLEDYHRKRIREIEMISEEDEIPCALAIMPGFEQHVTQQENVQKTLALLPEIYALVLIWRYRDEKSIREMAQLTDRTEKAMERLLARAPDNFKKSWSDARI